ncbi:MAG TPA: WxL domain-containing protein [Solirubrobacteraceae bacterium]|nr:WxL domain-containing protein [Solirubrobacteraceae bacterium]
MSFVGKQSARLRIAHVLVCAFALAGLLPAAALAATQEDKTQFSVTAGTLSFSTVPAMPTLSAITLNGSAQTTTTAMTNFGVADATGSGSGWNVTVAGQSGSGKSAVFAQYCPKATCGSDTEGYVGSGATLPANSLTLGSTGASFTGQNGSTGTAPTLQCGSSCNVDSASAVKIASGAVNAGMGTWLTGSWGAASLSLATPSTLKALANTEVYRVNLLWTLSTGP